MLRALPVVSVRQQQHETALVAPLVLAAHDEVVDQVLRDVCEVAELRLPDRQRVVVGQRVAVLEAQDSSCSGE